MPKLSAPPFYIFVDCVRAYFKMRLLLYVCVFVCVYVSDSMFLYMWICTTSALKIRCVMLYHYYCVTAYK